MVLHGQTFPAGIHLVEIQAIRLPLADDASSLLEVQGFIAAATQAGEVMGSGCARSSNSEFFR